MNGNDKERRKSLGKMVDHHTSEESENDCVYVKRNSKDASSSSNKRRIDQNFINEKKKKLERRKTLGFTEDEMKANKGEKMSVASTQCHCRSNIDTSKKCRCQRFRHTANPNISEADLLEHETRLVILEYIKSSARQMMARSRSRSQASLTSLDSFTPVSYTHLTLPTICSV